MAAAGVTDGGDLASSLVMSAQDDGIATPSGQVNGYASTPAPKRFVQIANAGHLVFSDLCYIGASEGGLLAIAEKYGVTGASTLRRSRATAAPGSPTRDTRRSRRKRDGRSSTSRRPPSSRRRSSVIHHTAQIAGIETTVPNVDSYQQALEELAPWQPPPEGRQPS